MGALKIDCYCSETQMTNIVESISSHLYNSDINDISDYDDLLQGVRVCVSFESYLDTVHLKECEVLDNDWEVLYEDTAVLTSRLKLIINDFNRYQKEACNQESEILKDQYEYAR
ncbi:hypothetical protein JGH11_10945 [Dysgonomonas sp. Marseille-P4677]|uniref:hypothetical protein n=1 Tax=Dysgonomonas sp. Marseille-P4677 TaxID=2364790 RepID=UPI0019144C68|nr:hypothetical protein [Dysgonomonas sp. Marseille-P4677]MBK5721390.1 hypothetical protein [Dysgonomonas sp. Marseille-P4677]